MNRALRQQVACTTATAICRCKARAASVRAMAKDRGITTISPRDAAVIGACVLGASTAFRLAEAGVGVTILEAGRGDAGSSGMSFA